MRPKSRLSVVTAVASIGSLLGSAAVLAADEFDIGEVANPVPRGPNVDPPFSVRDQNPLLAGFGLPVAMPSRRGREFGASLDISWGSTALTQEVGDEAVLLDAETREARVTLQGPLSDRFAWQLQLPYRYTGGGNLDSFIDSWHDFFGLAEGARPLLPRDQTNIVYARLGARQLDMRSSASGVADIQAALGYSVLDSSDTHVMTWLAVELPTGDEYKLTGNDATDVSLVLAAQRRLGQRWVAFGQVAGSWLGESDLLPIEQRDVVWSAMAGVSVRTWGGLSLKAQLDAHTAAYDSKLDILNEAVVLTVGGHIRFPFGQLDLGVSEDLAVEHSPDVVFLIGLKQAW
ncbi:DUF3187 family protein [Steroidobacter sp. S1-65]|uniref:DUF3187 family protein n=1 Tax=Steroidobacter gossypii TaxID=2805490 RepID=A0ABS1X2K3_9GAMM|nr:DUF3187 family protein [Steroidobacter gossypii]MBM0107412.1 DUF3187 family protein [Steroidobacter gossypii]